MQPGTPRAVYTLEQINRSILIPSRLINFQLSGTFNNRSEPKYLIPFKLRGPPEKMAI